MEGKFKLGDMVQKIKGSSWRGKVVGFYSTDLTPEGYAVESETEKGSVQIYPVAALELVDGPSEIERLRQQNAELLEALQDLYEIANDEGIVGDDTTLPKCAAAIAKATGGE